MFSTKSTKSIITVLGLIIVFASTGCMDRSGKIAEPYAVQGPLVKARIFAEGIISTNHEQNLSFKPDGRTVFFERANGNRGTLFESDFKDGKWGEPYIPSFARKGESEGNAVVAPDGKRVFFTSTRSDNGKNVSGYDIWYVDRSGNGWSEVHNIGAPVNTQYGETYPAVAANGNLYFNSSRPEMGGVISIYKSEFKNGAYGQPQLLGSEINGKSHSLTPYISPDETYLIFCRVIDATDADLYISYNRNGEWSPAEPLSPNVNVKGNIETAPSVSPNGIYLFFTRLTGSGENGGTIYQIDIDQAGIKKITDR